MHSFRIGPGFLPYGLEEIIKKNSTGSIYNSKLENLIYTRIETRCFHVKTTHVACLHAFQRRYIASLIP